MVRVSFWFFGYRIIRVEGEGKERVPPLFFNKKIQFVSPSPDEYVVSEKQIGKVRTLLKDKYSYCESECLGLGGAVRRIENKRGLAVGILISLVICLLFSNTVWDIKVRGNSSVTDSEIVAALSDMGLNIGDFWPMLNRTELENKLLLEMNDISWININRRGTVAYVVVSEKDKIYGEDEIVPKSGYANIVASVGCVIEEITVKRGQAEVKVGDVVKAGDILISGILPDEAGGGFCYAEGTVVGRVSDRTEVFVSREYEKTVKKELIPVSLDLKFFNLNINIFKKYRNYGDGCDIIEDVKVFSLKNDKSLPLSLNTRYILDYTKEKDFYTDEELVRFASREMSAKNALRLRSSDLIKITTKGEFIDSGYKMYSDLVFLSDVGRVVEFSAD